MTTPRVTVPVVSAAHRSEAEALAEVLRSRGRANSKHDIYRAANLLELLSAAPAPEGGATKLHLKLLDTLKPFAEVAEKLKHCHVVEICEPTPENPSRNIIPIPREWFERAADDLEAIAIQLHSDGALSEGQASKLTGLDRVEVRKLSDALATREEAPERRECDECGFKGSSDDCDKEQDYCTDCGGNSPAGGPDECAHCGAKNHMVMACPKCGGRFSLDEDAREEAPAEAGEDDLAARLRRAETWDLDADQEARDRCGVLMLEAAERLEALRAQPPAREDAQPMAKPAPFDQGGIGHAMYQAFHAYRADYVLSTDGDDYVPTPFERDLIEDFFAGLMAEEAFFGPIRALYDTHPAPDALRVAVEALERIATVDMGGGFLGAQACRQVATKALSDMKANQKGGA